jgi:hypothetical protein
MRCKVTACQVVHWVQQSPEGLDARTRNSLLHNNCMRAHCAAVWLLRTPLSPEGLDAPAVVCCTPHQPIASILCVAEIEVLHA